MLDKNDVRLGLDDRVISNEAPAEEATRLLASLAAFPLDDVPPQLLEWFHTALTSFLTTRAGLGYTHREVTTLLNWIAKTLRNNNMLMSVVEGTLTFNFNSRGDLIAEPPMCNEPGCHHIEHERKN